MKSNLTEQLKHIEPEVFKEPGALPEIDTSKFFEPLPESELSAWEGQL